jgi:hypothetical protein
LRQRGTPPRRGVSARTNSQGAQVKRNEEDLCDADLEALHETFRERAAETLDRLTRRRAEREHP